MTYRGTVHNGVIELEGATPLAEGTTVEVIPVQSDTESLASLPAFGLWRDRADLDDSAGAARRLRERVEQREDR